MNDSTPLRIAAWLMVLALVSMLVCAAWLTPRTLALFFCLGLPCAAASLALYLVTVIADLRSRKAL